MPVKLRALSFLTVGNATKDNLEKLLAIKRASLTVYLHRWRKGGLIDDVGDGYKITVRGLEYLSTRSRRGWRYRRGVSS